MQLFSFILWYGLVCVCVCWLSTQQKEMIDSVRLDSRALFFLSLALIWIGFFYCVWQFKENDDDGMLSVCVNVHHFHSIDCVQIFPFSVEKDTCSFHTRHSYSIINFWMIKYAVCCLYVDSRLTSFKYFQRDISLVFVLLFFVPKDENENLIRHSSTYFYSNNHRSVLTFKFSIDKYYNNEGE